MTSDALIRMTACQTDEDRDEKPDFLIGGGEMGARMRALDWSATPLGRPGKWPQSLKTIVRVMLDSRYAMWMLWGPELTFFCNDAYLPTVGIKRDWVLGARSDKVWEEIWPDIGPRIQQVLEQGRATWDERLLLFLERSGFPEETYHTFSYSPVYDDRSHIAGMLCVVTEVTEKVIGERRLRVLRDLAAKAVGVESVQESCDRLMSVLLDDPLDVPFACLYVLDPARGQAWLGSCTGVIPEALRPAILTVGDSLPWPIAQAIGGNGALVVELGSRAAEAIPAPLWPGQSIGQALVIPVHGQGSAAAVAVLVVGVSPRQALDENYRAFFDLVAGQFAAAIADAQAYEAERRRAEALAEIDRAKTTFFSNVSHEFRTPLTLMLGPVEEAIASLATPAALRGQLEMAHRNALRLLKLVNSLLDFSRIEAGRVQASYEPTDITDLTLDLASTFRSAIERAGLEFNVQCESLGEPVYVDREMWEKIVLNLLSNAFKFTLRGSITVSTYRDRAHAVLEVADTGVGIAEAELPRLFERFHRVENIQARTQEGSGIGLALVQELVKLQGSHIEVSSELGKGTTLRVRVPLGVNHLPPERIRTPRTLGATATSAQAFVQEALRWVPDVDGESSSRLPVISEGSAQSLYASSAASAGARIVLVDDNTDMRAYVRDLLAPYYDVEAVADGQQALAAIRRKPPELVLSDVMMPHLDGFGLLRALRADERLRRISFILLSARAGEESRIQGLDAGADDYLVKPFSARELLARVGASLTLARERRAYEKRIAADLEAMTRLRELGERCIRSGQQLEHCLEAILQTALFITGADKGNIQLLDHDSGALKIMAHHGFDQPFLDFFGQVRAGEPAACGAAMSLGVRVVVEDVRRSELFVGSAALDVLLTAGVCAVQSTPLLSSMGHTLGMISTHFKAASRPTERELQLMDLLARQAADYLERREVEELLRQQGVTLRETDRVKNEFLAMLAHELRNPLAPIGNATEILSLTLPPDTRGRTVLDMIKRQVSHLTRLVDDLLDVSRITQGFIQLERRAVDLAGVIAQAVEMLGPQLHDKQHRISVVTSSYVPLFVHADFARLVQCIGNILGNAAKYTDPGGEIRIHSRAEDSSAVIEISDTGVGIARELLPRIFDLFVQSERTLDRAQGGLGIGLSVVKRLVEMHDGKVTARSPGVGRGSVFEIRLPLIPRPEAPADAKKPVKGVRRRILIVDDNADAANSLAMLLGLNGHDTQVSYSAEEALERVLSHTPDVVLLDVGLPEMDGYELARRLKADPLLQEVRLIAVTGYGQTQDRQQTQAAGFDGHLVKPVDLADIELALAGLRGAESERT